MSDSQKPLLTTRDSAAVSCVIWIALEPAEIVELKRLVLDRDRTAAVELFYGTVLPRVRTAAQARGVAQDALAGEAGA